MCRDRLFVYLLVFVMLSKWIAGWARDGHASTAETSLSITARCEPHSDVVNPTEVGVRMSFTSSAQGPVASASMNVRGGTTYDSFSTLPHWEAPTKGWVSFVFEGPPLSVHYYCQTDWGNKPLHLSYNRESNIRLLLSLTGQTTTTEIDHQPTDSRTILSLAPNESTAYSAGHGSNNPFWLQVAIPVYNTGFIHTILRNDFM